MSSESIPADLEHAEVGPLVTRRSAHPLGGSYVARAQQ